MPGIDITKGSSLSGEGSAASPLEVADAGVTLAKMANVATTTLVGRVTSGTGAPEALTATQATTLLNAFTTSLKGLAPASGGGDENFLRADGTWNVPPGGAAVFNVTASAYGATGDGVTDDRAAIELARDAAVASGVKSVLYFPGGTYMISRDGANPWHMNLEASNVMLQGERGKTIIKAVAGQSAQVRMLHIDDVDNVTVSGIIFDGNWGNAVTYISEASDDGAGNGATFNVEDTTDFPASGTFTLVTPDDDQVITYTGKTSTSFTGCSGGSGTLKRFYVCGLVDANTGINHDTQADPKNHAIMIRGSRDVTIIDCEFRDVYGDMIWTGVSSDGDTQNWAKRIKIIRCHGSICARDCVTIGQPTEDVTITDCEWLYGYQAGMDVEPQGVDTPCRNLHTTNTKFGLWWNPNNAARAYNISVNLIGASAAGGQENMIRGARFIDCVIEGAFKAYLVSDLVLRDCRIICDFAGESTAPIYIDHFCDGVTIENNYIYDRSASSIPYVHRAAIHIIDYPFGLINSAPTGVRVANNRIYARNGYSGIFVSNASGFARTDATRGLFAPESNSSTSVTATTLVRTGAGWTVDKWHTWHVRIGAAHATVLSNTSDTLTLGGWFTPTGDPAPTPTSGAYKIFNYSGTTDIVGNTIDLANDGRGAGLYGVYFGGENAGGRTRIVGNTIKNATDYGILVVAAESLAPAHLLEIADNVFSDDQATQTMYYCIRFNAPTYINKLIIRNNAPAGSATIVPLSGINDTTVPSSWLLNDGPQQEWAGYATPEGAVTAPIGSTYSRLDGSLGAVQYIKNSGTGNTGWVSVGGVVASGSIVCTTKANYADTDYMTIGDGVQAPKLYEFDFAGDGVTAGRVQVNISGATTASDVAVILKAAIDANQPLLTVVNTTGTLALTHKLAGTFANVTITENVANAGHTVAGMTGGVNPGR